MALDKQQKKDVIDEVSRLLADSKMTVFVRYPGTSVKAMQQLRKEAKVQGTQIKVVKNRLFKKAVAGNPAFKDIDTGVLEGQLLYAFNPEDEVAPAQNLANFAKQQTQIEFVGAITADGQLLSSDDVKALASLPTKDQLRGMLVGALAGPASGFVNVLAGNLRGFINVLNAKAEV
jgi:large subunit ribosomal protein L10